MELTKNNANCNAEGNYHDDIRDGILSIEATNIDNFYDKALPTQGHHTVRIIHWEIVPEREIASRYMGKVTFTGEKSKPYILLDLKSDTGEVFDTKLYTGGVDSFMRNMAAQSEGAVMGMKISEILKYFGSHTMDVWVRWDNQYGVQVDYYDRDEKRW